MCCACGGGSDTSSSEGSCQDTDNGAYGLHGYTCSSYTSSLCAVGTTTPISRQTKCAVRVVAEVVIIHSSSPSPSPTTDEGSCQDTDNGASDSFGDTCSVYTSTPSWCGGSDDDDFTSNEMCCACEVAVIQHHIV